MVLRPAAPCTFSPLWPPQAPVFAELYDLCEALDEDEVLIGCFLQYLHGEDMMSRIRRKRECKDLSIHRLRMEFNVPWGECILGRHSGTRDELWAF